MDILSWRHLLRPQTKRCVLCHGRAVSDGLCAGCAADLSACRTDAAHTCPRCAQAGSGPALCGQCQQHPPPFERLWASVYYEPPVSSMIHAFKHLADTGMQPPLQRLMLDHPPPWLEQAGIDAVLAMPLSRERRLFRGFNQAEGPAEAVGSRYGLPVLSRHTVFRRHHVPQSTLKREERRKNVRNAFVINHEHNQDVKNRKILLVDDVATTGATFESLAATLIKAGACAVFCWALASARMKK